MFNTIDTLTTNVTGLTVKRKNGVVTVSYNGTHTGGPSNVIYTLPVGYRPLAIHRINIYPSGSTSNLNMMIYTNGNIAIDSNNGGPTSGVQGGYSFVCDQNITI